MRDAHQSLFATRLRTFDLLRCRPAPSRTRCRRCSPLEVLGRRDLRRRAALPARGPVGAPRRGCASASPTVCLQMLLRGHNLLGYEPLPRAGVVRAFVAGGRRRPASTSSASSTRSTTWSRCARRSRRRCEAGAVAEGALCYTGDLSDPARDDSTRSTTTCGWPSSSRRPASHILAIKDMAGLLRAPAARTLVGALRERVRPARAPAHPRHRRRAARHLPGGARGRRGRRGRRGGPDGGDDEPAVAVEHRRRDRPHGARHRRCRSRPCSSSSPTGRPCGRCTRRSRRGCGRRPAASTGTRSPAASSPTCASRRSALGLGRPLRGGRARLRARRRRCSGNIVKVTPTSKVVGDLALFAVSGGIDWDELREQPAGASTCPAPCSGSCAGELGEPAGGLPQPFAARALRAEARSAPADEDGQRGARGGAPTSGWPPRGARGATPCPRSSSPARRKDRAQALERYGDVSVHPHRGLLLRPARREGADHRPRAGRASSSSSSRRSARPTTAGCAPCRDAAQRADAADRRARRVRRGRAAGARARRSGRSRPRRRAADRRGHRARRGRATRWRRASRSPCWRR